VLFVHATKPIHQSLTYNDRNEPEEWRTWWMTEGVEDENGIPVRDEDEEIQ
jgi:hypothetical protein